MTTLKHIELTCPICSNRFNSQAVLSTNSFGGKRTDFHERAAGAQPLPYFIHLCSRCGYDLRGALNEVETGNYVLVNTRTNEDRKVFKEAPVMIQVERDGALFCQIKQIP